MNTKGKLSLNSLPLKLVKDEKELIAVAGGLEQKNYWSEKDSWKDHGDHWSEHEKSPGKDHWHESKPIIF